MEALGRLFDITAGAAVVDLAGGAVTGNRVHLKGAGGVTIVMFKEAGAAGEAPVLTLRQHTASTSGTSSDLATVDHYYLKSEATLDGDETWTRVPQTKAAAVTLTGTGDTQCIAVIEVESTSLSDNYEWVSVDIADITTAAQFGGVLYLLRDLSVQRGPVNLPNPLA